MTHRNRYSQQDKQLFWRRLDEYREALRTGENLVTASLRVYAALGNVPKSYAREVRRVFRETTREPEKCPYCNNVAVPAVRQGAKIWPGCLHQVLIQEE